MLPSNDVFSTDGASFPSLRKFFNDCPGRGANVIFFGFIAYSLTKAASWTAWLMATLPSLYIVDNYVTEELLLNCYITTSWKIDLINQFPP